MLRLVESRAFADSGLRVFEGSAAGPEVRARALEGCVFLRAALFGVANFGGFVFAECMRLREVCVGRVGRVSKVALRGSGIVTMKALGEDVGTSLVSATDFGATAVPLQDVPVRVVWAERECPPFNAMTELLVARPDPCLSLGHRA
jgi:hypothetical protein